MPEALRGVSIEAHSTYLAGVFETGASFTMFADPTNVKSFPQTCRVWPRPSGVFTASLSRPVPVPVPSPSPDISIQLLRLLLLCMSAVACIDTCLASRLVATPPIVSLSGENVSIQIHYSHNSWHVKPSENLVLFSCAKQNRRRRKSNKNTRYAKPCEHIG